jgi:hypothetical protein
MMTNKFCYQITHNERSLKALRIGSFLNNVGLKHNMFAFERGKIMNTAYEFNAEVEQEGPLLNFNFTSEMLPFVTGGLKEKLEQIISPNSIQFLLITNYKAKPIYILNILNIIECVDEAESIFKYRQDINTGKTIPGDYKRFDKMVLNYDKIKDMDFFRIKGWAGPLYLTDKIKDLFDSIGINELKYYPTEVA